MSERTVTFTFDPECIEAENVREFHPEIVGAATGALRTMLDPEDDARAHRDADILASCVVSEALKALVTVADLDTQPDQSKPSSTQGGGSDAGDLERGSGYSSPGSACEPSGVASTSSQGGDAANAGSEVTVTLEAAERWLQHADKAASFARLPEPVAGLTAELRAALADQPSENSEVKRDG